jgi:hypothetical protein
LYHSLSGWKATQAEKNSTTLQDSPELEKALRAFTKAIIEAQLLFDDDSRIQEQLKQIKDDTFKVVGYRRDIVPHLTDPKEMFTNYQKFFLEPLQRVEHSLHPSSSNSLAEKMSKHLKYRGRFFLLPR